MSTVPLHLDSDLVNQARATGEVSGRSVTEQIEHWAKLGGVLDRVLSAGSVSTIEQLSRIPLLDEIVAYSQSRAGQDKTREVIFSPGMPTYSSDPENPDLLLERSPDGSVRKGRFVDRKFVPFA